MRARIADIIHHAGKLARISPATITGRSRKFKFSRVRQAVYLVAKEQMREDGRKVVEAYSYPQIARMLGGRDHSTIIHGVRTAQARIALDPTYAKFVNRLRNRAAGSEPFPLLKVPVAVVAKRSEPVRPHTKAITVRKGEAKDGGHKFQDGIKAGSDLLTAALAKAGAA